MEVLVLVVVALVVELRVRGVKLIESELVVVLVVADEVEGELVGALQVLLILLRDVLSLDIKKLLRAFKRRHNTLRASLTANPAVGVEIATEEAANSRVHRFGGGLHNLKNADGKNQKKRKKGVEFQFS